MAGRPKTLADDVDKLHASLTPEEQYVLQTIRVRRKNRNHLRCTASQIVADGLWLILVEVEGITREEIGKMMTTKPLREDL